MWKAVHITYYEDNKEDLVLDAIRPTISRLKEAGLKRWFLRRHWKRGPHIAIILDAEEDEFQQRYVPIIQGVIQPYLDQHPSQHTIDVEKYAKQSETLGAWELEPGPYLPLQPDNSISIEPYHSKAEVLNGMNVVQLVEDFRVNTADLLLDILFECRIDPKKKIERLIQMMTVIGQMYPIDGIIRGHLSYRSHVEGYLHTFDSNGQIGRAFQERDQAFGDQVDQLLLSVLEHTDEQGLYTGEDPILQQWSQSLNQLMQRALMMAEIGEISSNTDHYKEVAATIGIEAVKRWSDNEGSRELSAFHKHLQSEEEGLKVLSSPHFAAYRMLVNIFYAQLPLFQVNPNTKHLLCYLVANSVERIKGVTWQELMGFSKGASNHA